MAVRVRIYGLLRMILHEREVAVEFPGGSLAELVDVMSQKFSPEVRSELLDEAGNLDHAYMVTVGGERVTDIQASVGPDDQVVITSMLAGG